MKYNGENLKEVLEAHLRWLSGGASDEDRANFIEADLTGADLCGADLRGADLRFADLRWANLYKANLYQADLRGADFGWANLCKTDFSEADLYCAYLSEANLADAIMPDAPMACPDTGSFIGWKKCRNKFDESVIVKLLIPDDAKRTSGWSRKCRCSKAIVLDMQYPDGRKDKISIAQSMFDTDFVYKIGETVIPKEPFDENRWNECSSGIHFFITRKEAVDY